ncbi:MAG: glutaredoxin family protein [bacterium]
MTHSVVLVGKPGCHLCDDARDVVARVCDELGVPWSSASSLDDPVLADRYWDQIPVVLVDGDVHDFFRVDADRLRRALSA